MRTYRARGAAAAALLLILLSAATASATSGGIRIVAPPLVTQRGVLRFTAGVQVIVCNATLTKTLITQELIPVRPGGLTKLGKITSGRVMGCARPTMLLNLPRFLGGIPAPGPNPESWDLSYLSSNLPGGELNFGILDFQAQIMLNEVMFCLYRGALLGTLSTDGRILRYFSNLPLSVGLGCPGFVTVEGTFTNEPPIIYMLLPAP